MKSNVEEIFKFPYELVDAIKALSEHECRRILEVIINTNAEHITYDEIKKLTGYANSNLEYHLKMLSQSALIDRYVTHLVEDTEQNSYYRLSPFGSRVIRKLMCVFNF